MESKTRSFQERLDSQMITIGDKNEMIAKLRKEQAEVAAQKFGADQENT